MAKARKGARKTDVMPRRKKFSDDEGLKEAIRERALDTLWGARRIAAELDEDRRPSYVTVQALLDEMGLGTREERRAAREAAELGEKGTENAVTPWEHAYLETQERHAFGEILYVSIILDRSTARARVGCALTFESENEAKFIEHLREKEKCSIGALVIGRGGTRRQEVGPELKSCLEERGTTYHFEGRWGNMGAHRERLFAIIDAELYGVRNLNEAGKALARAARLYNEETPWPGYPTFGETPDRAWLKLVRGKPGVPWTTRQARRNGLG